MRNASQGQNGSKIRHGSDFRRQISAAVLNLVTGNFILRRHTTNRIGDSDVYQTKSVVFAPLIVAFRPTVFLQHRIQQIPRIISGKRTVGLVCAVKSGSKTHHQDLSFQRTKRLHRTIVIMRILGNVRLPKFNQARAFATAFIRTHKTHFQAFRKIF